MNVSQDTGRIGAIVAKAQGECWTQVWYSRWTTVGGHRTVEAGGLPTSVAGKAQRRETVLDTCSYVWLSRWASCRSARRTRADRSDLDDVAMAWAIHGAIQVKLGAGNSPLGRAEP
jgi:hypothetical protein